jgi:hypothetical protein
MAGLVARVERPHRAPHALLALARLRAAPGVLEIIPFSLIRPRGRPPPPAPRPPPPAPPPPPGA